MIHARAQQALHRTGQAALTVTAVLGALALLLTVLALLTGARPLIFRSGSMSPGIPAGSLGFARDVDAPDIRTGDVVTVPMASGDRVTHRVVAVTYHADVATLRLKGDANNAPDEALYRVTQAQRLWFSVPRVGSMVSWLSSAPGSYVLALYVGLMLLLLGRRRPEADGSDRDALPTPATADAVEAGDRETEPESRRPLRRGSTAVLSVGVLAVLGVAVVSGWGQSTWALWTDAATVGTSTIASGSWAGPTLTCTKGNSIVTMNWTAWPGATGYILHFGVGGSSTATVSSSTLSRVFNTVGQSGTFTVEATTAGGNSPLSNAKAYVIGSGVGNTSCTDA